MVELKTLCEPAMFKLQVPVAASLATKNGAQANLVLINMTAPASSWYSAEPMLLLDVCYAIRERQQLQRSVVST